MKKIHNKLVRDNIPEIIEKAGKECKIRILDEDEYVIELKKKLCEEATEVLETNSKKELIEEISDVLEIIDTLKKVCNICNDELMVTKNNKIKKNGAFEKRLFLEYVVENEK